MKKQLIIVSFLLAFLFATGAPASMGAIVFAQDPVCHDATGAVIPCPPEQGGGGEGSTDQNDEDDDSDNSSSSGNQNPPPSVNTPIPTATPFPITDSTDDSDSAGAEWSGTCKGSVKEVTRCIGLFTNGCEHVGGTVSSTIKDGEVTLTCKVPAVLPPTPMPFAYPEDDYLGTCTSENFAECRENFTCEDGLLVIEVDIYADGGTKYDFYCIPHEELPDLGLPITSPADSDDDPTKYKYAGVCHFGDGYENCMSDFFAQCDEDGGLYDEIDTGKGATVATCELPEKSAPTEEAPAISAAPTDDGATEGSSWDEECGYLTCWISSLSCLADGGSGYELDHASGAHIYHCDIPNSSSSTLPPSGWLPGLGLGIVVGVVLLPAIQKVRDSAARVRRAEIKTVYDLKDKPNDPAPQTREHILLANKDDGSTSGNTGNSSGSNSSTGGSGDSKPKPKPKPKPSSSPHPTSGDFNSDGTVDGNDFLRNQTDDSGSADDVIVTREEKDRR